MPTQLHPWRLIVMPMSTALYSALLSIRTSDQRSMKLFWSLPIDPTADDIKWGLHFSQQKPLRKDPNLRLIGEAWRGLLLQKPFPPKQNPFSLLQTPAAFRCARPRLSPHSGLVPRPFGSAPPRAPCPGGSPPNHAGAMGKKGRDHAGMNDGTG